MLASTGVRLAIVLLVLGIFFRVYNLDHKVYWLDEAYTSLRLSGYTRAEFVHNVFTGSVVDVATLQQYQHPNPDKTLIDTLKSIASEEPQVTPLYFVLAKFWVALFGNSIAAIRSLSAIISLLTFPCLWWLCRELFAPVLTAWMALGIVSLSPLHVLYAQEARPYSLWTVIVLLSSATLLWAVRRRTIAGWAIYALSVAIGLYTQLLFGLVALAHGVYLLFYPPVRRALPAYLLATMAGCLTLIPWLFVLFGNLDQAQARLTALTDESSLSSVINQWCVNASRVLIGWDLGAANLLVVAGIGYALYFLSRTASQSSWLFIMTLVSVGFLGLALPDVLLGGERSTRIRYLIPSYLGIQLAIAHLLAMQGWLQLKETLRGRWRSATAVLLTINLAACLISSQAQVWWNKSVPRSSYYPPVSRLINRADQPLVITDDRPIDLLAFSYWLHPQVKFQLVTDPVSLRIATGFNAIFLLNPSKDLRSTLTRQNYQVKLIYEDDNAPENAEKRLWSVRPGKSSG